MQANKISDGQLTVKASKLPSLEKLYVYSTYVYTYCIRICYSTICLMVITYNIAMA